MIQKYAEKFPKIEQALRDTFTTHVNDYKEIVQRTLMFLSEDPTDIPYGEPDFNNIHVIDDGDYQGTLLYVIPEGSYQPDDYFYVKVNYGSCSACDTLLSIEAMSEYGSIVTDQQKDAYLDLCRHVAQGIKKI